MSDLANWDAIVIGSGLGGLAAGAALARRGQRVLVLEKLANFGGAATIYRHGSLTMEASLHETDGETVHGPHGAFARLGLSGSVEPVPTDVFYEARSTLLPGPVQIRHGLDRAEDDLARALPHAAAAIRRYFREVDILHQVLHELEEMSARGPAVLAELVFSGRLFKLIGDARRTLGEAMQDLLGNHEDAKIALGAPLPYFDDDPAKMSFLLYAGVWSRYVDSGSYYMRGGSRALVFALLGAIREAGGEARHGCRVDRILLDASGRASGVSWVDGRGERHEATARNILGNAAPAHLADMLPPSTAAPLSDRAASLEPSISLFTVSMGLSRPAAEFGVSAYSTFVFPDSMTRFADMPAAAAVFGDPDITRIPPYVIADYGRLDTGLRQEGDPHFVSITGVDRFARWAALDEPTEKDRRRRWMDAMIADANRLYPGFGAAVTQAEIATSRTMRTRMGTPQGEVYGFRPTPARLFGRPPSPASGVPGLWIASAYTVSGGYTGSMQGGMMAADAILRSQRRRR